MVGNITAGGTGKTPLVIALVARLRAAGWTPGIASRGHGREHEATPRWVDADAAASLVGDEPLLIARATAAKVRVDRDRVAAARALVAIDWLKFCEEAAWPEHGIAALASVCRHDDVLAFGKGVDQCIKMRCGNARHIAEQHQCAIRIFRQCGDATFQ